MTYYVKVFEVNGVQKLPGNVWMVGDKDIPPKEGCLLALVPKEQYEGLYEGYEQLRHKYNTIVKEVNSASTD